MMGFETDNAHIMLQTHGNDINTLCKNITDMFTNGQKKIYGSQFETNQNIDKLVLSLATITDLLHRVTLSDNVDLNEKNLNVHNSSTLHEGSILSADAVSSAHNTERSGNPQKNMTNKGDQKNDSRQRTKRNRSETDGSQKLKGTRTRIGKAQKIDMTPVDTPTTRKDPNKKNYHRKRWGE